MAGTDGGIDFGTASILVDIKGKERVESVTLAQVDENRKPIPEHSLKYRYQKGSIYYDGLQKQLQ